MLNFEEEIKKFHPVMGIDAIEEEITAEDMSDLIDLVKKYTSIGEQQVTKQTRDKE